MAEETAVKETPLPWKKVIPVLILLAAEAFNGVSIFAYITLLVIDFKPELRDPETGDVKGAGYDLHSLLLKVGDCTAHGSL